MKKTIFAMMLSGIWALPVAADYTVKGSFDCQAAMREDGNEHYREYNKWWLLGVFHGAQLRTAKERGLWH